MSFVELPAELQLLIFGYLDHTDLKSTRRVCTRFYDNASPALFRSVVVCTRYQALGAFQKVSLHSTYAKYVKELLYDASFYDTALAANEHEYVRRADEVEDLDYGFSFQKRTRWKRYQQLWRDQEELQAGGPASVLFQTIAKALDWMPNVSSVVYSPGPHDIPAEAKEVRDLLPRGIVDSSAHANLQRSRVASFQHSFHNLIGAICYSQYTGICEFNVKRAQADAPSSAVFTLHAFDLPEESLEAGKYFFRHLRKLQLDISLVSTIIDGNIGDEEMLSNLAILLSEAQQLRDLKLRFYPWRSDQRRMYGHIAPYGQTIFSRLGLNTTWPRLRSITLGGIFATEADLITMIKRHRETPSPLASLKLSFCSLTQGRWANIVDEVVYGTTIMPFVLENVNETVIGDMNFENMIIEEQEQWQYEGQLNSNSDGERYFVSQAVIETRVEVE